jgi:hypothetical protein
LKKVMSTQERAADLMADQRGVTRPLGGGSDIGAVELLPLGLLLPSIRK